MVWGERWALWGAMCAVAFVVGCGADEGGQSNGEPDDVMEAPEEWGQDPIDEPDVVEDVVDVVEDEPDMMMEEEPACEQVWVPAGAGSIFAYEASRPDANDVNPGQDGSAACSRPGVIPWTGVTWQEAVDACESIGAQLCGGVQWDEACKGPGRAIFPYGADYDPNVCNVLESPDGCLNPGSQCRVVATGVYEGCVSEAGAFDMSGNVAEWVADLRPFGEEAYDVRGGSYLSADDNTIRCRNANVSKEPGFTNPDLGFRCCK